jgi:AcrR family transcriptional regulator
MARLPEHLRGTATGRERVSQDVLDTHQRERVIAAAIPVFAKRGYQGTTVDGLLAAGKIGVGNFYSLFEGKENCFLATFDSIVDAARGRIAEAAGPANGWAEEAAAGLRELLAIVLDDQRAARVVLIEAQAAGTEATRRYEAILDDATGWLRAGRVGRTDAEGLPATFERSAIAGLAYYLQQCLFSGSVPAAGELFDEVSSVILAPVIGGEELRRLRDETGLGTA